MIGTNIFIGERDIKLIKNGDNQIELNGKWVTARPVGYASFLYRLRCAWLVLINEADIVIWEQNGWKQK